MGRLANKAAIITGAASGMGETTARVFAREGATVIITDVQEQAIKDLVADIQGEYGMWRWVLSTTSQTSSLGQTLPKKLWLN
ncbi:SDR family NAD(P)-dependent oxidoreductase [Neisseria weixii]|nr:SDR family NAD(P)-dependent oxidoreductase [Neisseria weixii]